MTKKKIMAIAAQDNQGNKALVICKGYLTKKLIANCSYINDGPALEQMEKIINEWQFKDIRQNDHE